MIEPERQVHLDFHTSEKLPGIGSRFRKEQFQQALQLGRVNLINVFAKCHHSWSYYPTLVGRPHPNLACDLLGGQIEACHEIGVAAPIYFTMGWSAQDAEDHPEWCMRKPDGSIVGDWGPNPQPGDPKPAFQWKMLCPSGEYHDLAVAQTVEICRNYPVDGLWYDIYQAHHLCYCENCRRGMAEAGLDAGRVEDAAKWRAETIRRHAEELKRVILGFHPEASVYFNGLTQLGRLENARYQLYAVNTKNDLEDLPTTWGGYDKFPIRAKFFHKENKPIVAMSGKFHTSWGEFGGFKDREAMRYEAAAMIAFGARCNFGDQLHPSGEMDLGTYANIGHAYEYVEKIAEYGIESKPASSLALWLAHSSAHDEGVARMLFEEQIDFDIAGPGDDLSRFEVVVVPSKAGAIEGCEESFRRYLAHGGKLIVLGEGALDLSASRLLLDLGAAFEGPARFDVDYTVAGDALSRELARSPFLNYEAAVRARPGDRAEILAHIREPYFRRTYGAYCGHQNTPYQLENASHPAAIRAQNTVWMTHGLDKMYFTNGARTHRRFFIDALRLLHRRPMIETRLPSAGRINLLHQPDRRRYVAHLLYAPPLQRGRCLVIEDMPPLRDVALMVRLPKPIARAWLVPGEMELPISHSGDMLKTVIPEFACHCAVAFEY